MYIRICGLCHTYIKSRSELQKEIEDVREKVREKESVGDEKARKTVGETVSVNNVCFVLLIVYQYFQSSMVHFTIVVLGIRLEFSHT